jgi:endogenous inhibitor of DNA gyrase (YacG/DUF329 family)
MSEPVLFVGCPTCGKAVSKQAAACPSCGHQFKAPGAFNPFHDLVHGCLVLVVIGFVLFCILAIGKM